MSDRDTFRAEQQERRQFGKAKQHEKRLERAVRKQVAEEIAAAIEAYKDAPTRRDDLVIQAVASECASIAREIGRGDPA